MLYNIEKERVKRDSDCNWCKYFNKITKTCNGIGENCFKYDSENKTYFDPIQNKNIKVED